MLVPVLVGVNSGEYVFGFFFSNWSQTGAVKKLLAVRMHFVRLNRVYLTPLNCICQMLTKFSWTAELYPSLKRKLNSSARVLDYIHKTSDKVVSRCGRAVDVKEMCQEVWCEFKVVGLPVKPNWTARSSSPWLPSRSQRGCDGVTKLYFWYPWKTIYSLVSISVSESVTFEVTDR